MNRPLHWLLVAAIAVVLAGCASGRDDIDDAEMAEIDRAATEGSGAAAAGAAGSGGFTGEALEDPSSPLSERVIYFDFDASTLSDEGMRLIRAHGEFLAANPQRRMLIEGHTDERGSREYNLALGERRADAVRQALLLNGASSAQLSTVSFGEESPAVLGSSEAAWAQNRRAELLYER